MNRDFNLFPELGFEGFIDFRLEARMLDANDLFFTGSKCGEKFMALTSGNGKTADDPFAPTL